MKFLLVPILALLLVGCSSVEKLISPATVQSGVAAGVSYGLAKYPASQPAVEVARDVICAAAHGTNVSPASVVEAIENSDWINLQTPEATFIVQGAVSIYSLAYNAIVGDSVVDSEKLQPYLQAVCQGMATGIPVKRNTFRVNPGERWPQLSFP